MTTKTNHDKFWVQLHTVYSATKGVGLISYKPCFNTFRNKSKFKSPRKTPGHSLMEYQEYMSVTVFFVRLYTLTVVFNWPLAQCVNVTYRSFPAVHSAWNLRTVRTASTPTSASCSANSTRQMLLIRSASPTDCTESRPTTLWRWGQKGNIWTLWCHSKALSSRLLTFNCSIELHSKVLSVRIHQLSCEYFRFIICDLRIF